jgi:hypothetical protein
MRHACGKMRGRRQRSELFSSFLLFFSFLLSFLNIHTHTHTHTSTQIAAGAFGYVSLKVVTYAYLKMPFKQGKRIVASGKSWWQSRRTRKQVEEVEEVEEIVEVGVVKVMEEKVIASESLV